MSVKRLSCCCLLVLTMVFGFLLPFSIFPLSIQAKVVSGSPLAGIKGYSYEVATLPTSLWTTMMVDLKDGNFLLQAKPIDLPGISQSISFEIMYNSVNHDLDLGLGKGWTSNLFESVWEDPTTHHVTYVNKTGAIFLFIWDPVLNQYSSPNGFEGTLTKQTNNTYQITDWNYLTTTFDTAGKLTKISRLSLDLVTYQYDTTGSPISIHDAISNRTITFTWNQGVITEAKDTMNQIWKLNYSANLKNLLSIEKPDQSKTEFTYDSKEYLLTQKDFTGQTYTVSYVASGANEGKVATLILPNSSVYQFSYENNVNGYSSKTKIIDPENFTTSYFFGTSSHHVEKISATDGTIETKTTYQYDASSFITQIGDSYQQTVIYSRDTNHQIIQITYPPATLGGDQFQIQYLYDPITHLKIQKLEKINSTPVWATTSYEYSDQDCPVRVSKQTDPLGTETIYDYNPNHQIISMTTGTGLYSSNDTKSRSYSYSSSGNLNTYTDSEGNETTYVNNANGFVVDQIQFEGPAQSNQVTSNLHFSYNTTNQVTEATNISSNLIAAKAFDNNGAELSSTSFGGCSSSNTRGVSFLIYQKSTLDKGGPGSCLNPVEKDFTQIKIGSLGIIPADMTMFSPKQTSLSDGSNHTFTYEYFGNGTLKKEIDYMSRTSVVTLDSLGRIGKITDWNDKDISFSYDLDNRMIGRNEEGIGNFAYTYYLNGRMKSLSDPQRSNIFFNYNLYGNLLSDEKGFYSYDLKGNLLTANYFNGSSDTWGYSREGYIVSKNGDTYTTDKLGNQELVDTEYGSSEATYVSSLNQIGQITGTGDMGSYNLSYNASQRISSFQDTTKNNLYHYAWNGNATLAELLYPNLTKQTYTYLGKHPDVLEVKIGSSTLFASNTDFNSSDQATSFSYEFTAAQISHTETTQATYDSSFRTSSLSYSSDNQVVQYGYLTGTGVLSTVSVSGTGTYQILNSPSGKLNQIIYPNNGGFETYSYNDNLGRVSNISYPGNRSLSFSWNSKNQITQIFGADMGSIFSYNVTYDRMGKMKSYTKSENGMQTESWLFSYGIFGIEKASRNHFGIQDIVIDFTTDFSGRVVSMNYSQIEGYVGELYFHYDNYGNTSILTDTVGSVVVGYLYKLHNGKITYTFNPSNIVNPFSFHARSGYQTLNAFGSDLQIQINSIGTVNLSGSDIGWIDLRAPAGGALVAGGNKINITVNDSISPCLQDCEKKGMVKCCMEYRSRGECEKNCNGSGSGNDMNEHDPSDSIEECVKKCGNNCKEWGCCNTGSSPSV